MLDALLSILGWLVVALVVGDVFRTVLWSGQGAGPLTSVVTATARRAVAATERPRPLLQSVLGPAVLLIVVTIWAALLLVGFTLVLQMDPAAIRTATTDAPTDWFERGYYVGYTLFTLGNGSYAPTTDLMRAVTVLMNGLGMFLVTLSVTYLLPVVSASVGSRSFASSATSLGDDPSDVLVATWDGHRVHLDHQLRELASALSTLAQQHLAYPVLHLFDSSDRATSAPFAVCQLDDVLTLLDAVESHVAPPEGGRRQLRGAIESYVETYASPVPADTHPPRLTLDALDAAGIPLAMDQDGFDRLLAERAERRRQVHGLAEASNVEGS